MPQNSDEIQKVKAAIEAVLVSTSENVTVEGLRRDYKEINGTDIPFRSLGFRTLQEMLCSFSDILQIHYLRSGGILLSAKPKSSNVHIMKLVEEQKASKPKGRSKVSRGSAIRRSNTMVLADYRHAPRRRLESFSQGKSLDDSWQERKPYSSRAIGNFAPSRTIQSHATQLTSNVGMKSMQGSCMTASSDKYAPSRCVPVARRLHTQSAEVVSSVLTKNQNSKAPQSINEAVKSFDKQASASTRNKINSVTPVPLPAQMSECSSDSHSGPNRRNPAKTSDICTVETHIRLVSESSENRSPSVVAPQPVSTLSQNERLKQRQQNSADPCKPNSQLQHTHTDSSAVKRYDVPVDATLVRPATESLVSKSSAICKMPVSQNQQLKMHQDSNSQLSVQLEHSGTESSTVKAGGVVDNIASAKQTAEMSLSESLDKTCEGSALNSTGRSLDICMPSKKPGGSLTDQMLPTIEKLKNRKLNPTLHMDKKERIRDTVPQRTAQSKNSYVKAALQSQGNMDTNLTSHSGTVSGVPSQVEPACAGSGSSFLNVKKPTIPNDVRLSLKKIIDQHPKGFALEMVIPLYKSITGNQLNLSALGFTCAADLIAAVPDEVSLKEGHNGFTVVSAKKASKVSQQPLSVESGIRLKCFLQNFPAGISHSDLEEKYMKEFPSYAADLDWRRKGWNSLLDLLKTAPPGIFTVQSSICGPYFYPVNDNSSKISSVSQSPMNPVSPQIEGDDWEADCDVESRLLFGNVVFHGSAFTPVDVDEVMECDFLNVVIGEIYSPYLFYMIIDDADHFGAIEKMTSDLLEFYSGNNLKMYHLRQEHYVIQQPVVFIDSEGQFCRGTIMEFCGFSYAKVFAEDFGSMCVVHVDSLWYMHKKFVDLPTQAIQAKLWGIRPPGSKKNWSEKTAKRLLGMVNEKSLRAEVIEKENCVFSIRLTDKQLESNISINARLVFEQLAENLPGVSKKVERDISTQQCAKPTENIKTDDASAAIPHAQGSTSCSMKTESPCQSVSSNNCKKDTRKIEVFTLNQLLHIRNEVQRKSKERSDAGNLSPESTETQRGLLNSLNKSCDEQPCVTELPSSREALLQKRDEAIRALVSNMDDNNILTFIYQLNSKLRTLETM